MKKRMNISSGAIWEDIVGYSRAVRIGNVIEVAGTTAADGEEILFPGLAYEQTQYVLLKIEQCLKDAGASLADVVRTRIFTTNIILWEDIGPGTWGGIWGDQACGNDGGSEWLDR